MHAAACARSSPRILSPHPRRHAHRATTRGGRRSSFGLANTRERSHGGGTARERTAEEMTMAGGGPRDLNGEGREPGWSRFRCAWAKGAGTRTPFRAHVSACAQVRERGKTPPRGAAAGRNPIGLQLARPMILALASSGSFHCVGRASRISSTVSQASESVHGGKFRRIPRRPGGDHAE